MLQFRNAGIHNLTTYNFNDQMSSWRNRRYGDAKWFYDIGANYDNVHFCMPGNRDARNPFVGTERNDEASSLQLYNSATVAGCP